MEERLKVIKERLHLCSRAGASLRDALDEFAEIPDARPLKRGEIPSGMRHNHADYADWPYKILFAYDGIDGKRIVEHMQEWDIEHAPVLDCR